jgi:hypothetical protein
MSLQSDILRVTIEGSLPLACMFLPADLAAVLTLPVPNMEQWGSHGKHWTEK